MRAVGVTSARGQMRPESDVFCVVSVQLMSVIAADVPLPTNCNAGSRVIISALVPGLWPTPTNYGAEQVQVH